MSIELGGKRIYVAGHRGMVGSAILRHLKSYKSEILINDLDLRDQKNVRVWMEDTKPDIVIIAAAHVGGILANKKYPATFLYNNLMIETNLIHAAYEVGVHKLLFLGSSCIYPKNTSQPITEEMLLTGALEPTNEAYAIAKIAGIKLCQSYQSQYGCNFISVMPCNLYGPGDRYDAERSHVIPALMMRAHEAKMSGASELVIWGTGNPRREFLYIDDLARGALHALQHYEGALPLNIGSGEDISIRDLAHEICRVVGFDGALRFDHSYPDGTMSKVLNVSRLHNLGWRHETSLCDGLARTYGMFKKEVCG